MENDTGGQTKEDMADQATEGVAVEQAGKGAVSSAPVEESAVTVSENQIVLKVTEARNKDEVLCDDPESSNDGTIGLEDDKLFPLPELTLEEETGGMTGPIRRKLSLLAFAAFIFATIAVYSWWSDNNITASSFEIPNTFPIQEKTLLKIVKTIHSQTNRTARKAIRPLHNSTIPLNKTTHENVTSPPPNVDKDDKGLIILACEGKQKRKHNPNSKLWKAMRDFAAAVNSINAPTFIHAGTLLGLVRHCTVFGNDVDFVIERSWYAENFDKLSSTLKSAGFRFKWFFPGAKRSAPPKEKRNVVGFETSSTKYGVKVDLFGVSLEKDKYIWGLWAPKSKYNKCPTPYSGHTRNFTWHGVSVKVPVPTSTILTALYGKKFMRPAQQWRWNIEPFKVGVCKRSRLRRRDRRRFLFVLKKIVVRNRMKHSVVP